MKNGINLTKSQKAALSLLPKQWVTEQQVYDLGLGRSTLLSLVSKGCIYKKVENGTSMFFKK